MTGGRGRAVFKRAGGLGLTFLLARPLEERPLGRWPSSVVEGMAVEDEGAAGSWPEM